MQAITAILKAKTELAAAQVELIAPKVWAAAQKTERTETEQVLAVWFAGLLK
jgi:hypothetical protein